MAETSKIAAAGTSLAITASLMAGDTLHTPATIEKPTPAALATRYACEMTGVEDLHRLQVADGAVRDTLIAHLKLTPDPKIAAYNRLFPSGSNSSDLQWFSSFGSAYVRLANLPANSKHPGYDVLVDSPYFYDKNNSPTHEDLTPTIKIMPSEERPSDQRVDVYVESEVYQKRPDGTLLAEYVGHTLCGSLQHIGALQWKQVASGPEVPPTYVSSRQIDPQ